ncbi:sensor histidine kinase [Ornithinimicrobium avium]|uniref:sensor histidine kinase n=1 Tax=Ornithinimicrobium avium TaxID=2283195 RepID=UPI0013B3A83F|nr:histidine kinase [Ornithinimicrobium avium]
MTGTKVAGAVRVPSVLGTRAGLVVRSVLLVVVGLLITVLAVASAGERNRVWGWSGVGGGVADAVQGLATLVALGAPFLLLMRRRDLANTAWGLGFLQLIFPIGPVMLLVLPQAVRQEERNEAESLGFLYVLGATVWFVRDAFGPTGAASVVRMVTAPVGTAEHQATPFNVYSASVVYLLVVVLPVVVAFYRRARHQLDDTRQEVEVQRATSGQLSARLTRQAERDLIAREVHDVIGHRLSLLTLHAGGLEVAADAEPDLRQSARYVRENAQRAMDDLRSLVTVLREPAAGPGEGPLSPVAVSSLSQLSSVVDEMANSGVPVASTVFLQGADEAAPVLAHSVYRIVQELLTNARKHAPSELLRLKVVGGPEDGVHIQASNALPPGAVPGGEQGSGLQGVAERVEILGGSLELPEEDGRFTVDVRLPWTGRSE